MKYVVIVGPDGCGKTTIQQGLNARLNLALSKEFSFRMIPSLNEILKGERRINVTPGVHFSGMIEPVATWKAIILSIWYGIDHFLGHVFIKNNHDKYDYMIFARSYHDFLFQRVYRNAPKKLIRFFLFIGPKPHAIFCLKRDAGLIYSVKPELSVGEINAQYERIYKGLHGVKQFKIVDANREVDNVLSFICEVMGKNE